MATADVSDYERLVERLRDTLTGCETMIANGYDSVSAGAEADLLREVIPAITDLKEQVAQAVDKQVVCETLHVDLTDSQEDAARYHKKYNDEWLRAQASESENAVLRSRLTAYERLLNSAPLIHAGWAKKPCASIVDPRNDCDCGVYEWAQKAAAAPDSLSEPR